MVSLAACDSSVSSGSGGEAGAATTSSTATTTTSSSTTSTTSSGQGGAPPSCPDPANPGVFEVGSGSACFEGLVPGQTVSRIQGPQGGFHIWASVGCADCGTQATVEYGTVDPLTGTWFVGAPSNLVVAALDPEGWHQISGLQARLPGVPWDETTQLPQGAHVILKAAVLDDALNEIHAAEVEVVLGDIEYWSPPCDDNPMTCGTPGGLPCCTFGGG